MKAEERVENCRNQGAWPGDNKHVRNVVTEACDGWDQAIALLRDVVRGCTCHTDAKVKAREHLDGEGDG